MSSKLLIVSILSVSITLAVHGAGIGDSSTEITKNSQDALASLYAKVDGAKALGAKAHAVLVFPKVTKAGLGIGGQRGEGALLKDGKAIGFYKTTGASVGLQAGAQTYGYAMFFMSRCGVFSTSVSAPSAALTRSTNAGAASRRVGTCAP